MTGSKRRYYPERLTAPFLRAGDRTTGMMLWVLIGLTLVVTVYSIRYNPEFLPRYLLVIAMGLGLEFVYVGITEGRFGLRSGSSAFSAGLLAASLPGRIPLPHIFFALVIAIVLTRMTFSPTSICLNPVLTGRLFLMLAYRDETVAWDPPNLIDGLTGATPLDFFHSEGEIWKIGELFWGTVRGSWGNIYQIIPGSPGEQMIFLLILVGIFLWRRGVLDWRCPVIFLASFIFTITALSGSLYSGEPFAWGMIFRVAALNMVTGSVVFSAVFIASDPRSTPASSSGRMAAGVIAGVINGLIRHFKPDHYGEGIVFAFLIVNILAPLLDRLAFNGKAIYLSYRSKRFLKN